MMCRHNNRKICKGEMFKCHKEIDFVSSTYSKGEEGEGCEGECGMGE